MRIELAEIDKANGAKIRIAADDYKGRQVIDLRIWYELDGESGYVPSRKGITFDAEKLPDISAAVANALSKAIEMGLLR